MKDYIKMFQDLQSADGYIIKDIPFTSTVKRDTGGGVKPQNVRCKQENKKIEVDEQGNISVVDEGPVVPSDEIWYTSSDGNIVMPYRTSSLPTIVSNTYSDGKGVIKFATDVTSIGYYAFSGCTGLASVTIGNSVTSIGYYAFSGCTGLASVTIGNSVTSIGDSAFYYCSSLTSVMIPDSVTYIGSYAFRGCSGLASVTVGNNVISIEYGAFDNCSSLTKVNIIDIAAWCNIQFVNYDSNPLYYAKHLYVNNVEVTDLVIPDGVTSIGSNAFNGCSGLTSVTIPNSVTSIGYDAFIGCNNAEFYYAGTSTQWHNAFDNVWAYDSFPFDESIYIHCLGDNVDVYVEQPEQPFCCFVVGTKVQLPNNVTKNIEDIAVGNSVISYNPTTDELYTTTVKNIIIHENTTTLARVTLANGSVVEMNEYHPILTRQGWHSITNYEGYNTLVIGDEVKTLDGYSKIVNIERWINEPITTYNLDVVDALGRDREYDNYFANGICVHNPPPCAG